MKLNVLALIMTLVLTGCGLLHEPGDDCINKGNPTDKITLSFKMVTSNILPEGRVDNQGHAETDSEYRTFEDGIDLNDLGLLVFAKIKGTDSDEKLLFKQTSFSGSNPHNLVINGSPGAYTVTLDILKDELNSLLDYEITPSGTKQIEFRILMLANCSAFGTSNITRWNNINATTYTGIIEQFSEWKYSFNYLYNKINADNGDNEVTQLYGVGNGIKKHIPMFGTNVYYASETSLYYSRPEDRIYLGEIDMLRAIAKVRVVDNIQNKVDGGYPKIKEAFIYSSQTQATQLPSDAVHYVNGEQVHTPSIVDNTADLTISEDIKFKLGTIPDSWSMTPANERTGDTFIGYIPEQKIGYADGNINKGLPMFRITVSLDPETEKTYDVPMTGYNGETFNFGKNILRNHIYTLSVDVNNANLNLNVAVNEWKTIEYEYEY